MATQSPFDFSTLFTSFNPQAMAKQLQEGFGNTTLPGIDSNSLLLAQHKNMELLMSTNQALMAGSQALIQRQASLLQEAIAEITAAAKSLIESGDPQDVSTKQVELLQSAFEKTLANAAEIGTMIRETQDNITDQVNTRIAESLQELKEAIAKVK